MKLRNKKTGEIGEVGYLCDSDGKILVNNINDLDTIYEYDSLAEFNAEWEDYKEAKEHWAIDQFGEPINVSGLSRLQLEKLHRLGNDFPSENATMKAVEKLKAAKRLKDKGFKSFSSNICGDDFVVNFKLSNHADYSQSMDDFDCVFDFGGEE